MASRPLWQFITCVGRTGPSKTAVRHVSLNYPCRAPLQAKNKTESVASPWKMMGAVCLQRLPVISQEPNPIETEFSELMHQMELEHSLLSDHELRLFEDAERMSRKQADDYDSDEEEEDYGGQDIVTAQDLEDAWEQKMKQIQPTLSARDAVVPDIGSARRCLGDTLVLLAEQAVGGDALWLLPQLQWEAGETLRQTAERALATLPEADFKTTFLSNAPCGVYKYKLPKAIRTVSCVGVKVFFFKAILSSSSPLPAQKGPFMWVKSSELADYLKPAYLEKVKRFILNL